MPCDESLIYCYDPETKRQNSQWKHAGFPRPKKTRQSKSTLKLLIIPVIFVCLFVCLFVCFFGSTGMIYMHWVPTRGIQCWGFKWVQESIPWEEARTLQIGSVVFPPGQCTSLQLHPCQTIWPRWASRQFLSLPIVQILLPMNGTTRALEPEEITSKGTRVSCVYYQ